MKLKFNFNKRNKYKNICSRDVLLEQINDKFTERYPEQSARLREETGVILLLMI